MLKGNQGTLNKDIRLFLEAALQKTDSTAVDDRYQDANKGHGRIETRACFVSAQVDWLNQKEQWTGLKTIVIIE